MDLYEAASYFLEVMDLPNEVPEYTISEDPQTGIVHLKPMTGDLVGYVVSIYKKERGTWSAAFDKEGGGFKMTNEFNFKVIPTAIKIVKDYYDKAEIKPNIITFMPKQEEDEIKYYTIISSAIDKVLQDMDKIRDILPDHGMEIDYIQSKLKFGKLTFKDVATLEMLYDKAIKSKGFVLNYRLIDFDEIVQSSESSKRGRIYKKIIEKNFPNAKVDVADSGAGEVYRVYPYFPKFTRNR